MICDPVWGRIGFCLPGSAGRRVSAWSCGVVLAQCRRCVYTLDWCCVVAWAAFLWGRRWGRGCARCSGPGSVDRVRAHALRLGVSCGHRCFVRCVNTQQADVHVHRPLGWGRWGPSEVFLGCGIGGIARSCADGQRRHPWPCGSGLSRLSWRWLR